MAAPAPIDRRLADRNLDRYYVRVAVKTAVAGAIAAGIANVLHLDAVLFGPTFVFLVMSMFPHDVWRAAWHGIAAILVCGTLMTLNAGLFIDQPLTFLILSLLLIGTTTLVLDVAPMVTVLGGIMSAAMMLDYIFDGSQAAQTSWTNFMQMFVLGMAVLLIIDRLLWPDTTRETFFDRLALFGESMADQVQGTIAAMRAGEAQPPARDTVIVADLIGLSNLAGTPIDTTDDDRDPRNALINHCRRLILRRALLRRCLRMGRFDRWDAETRVPMSDLFDDLIGFVRALSDAAATHEPVAPLGPEARARYDALSEAVDRRASHATTSRPLMAPVVMRILGRLLDDVDRIAESYNRIVRDERHGRLHDEPTPAMFVKPRIGPPELRRAVKVMLILLLLYLGQRYLGLPGGTQVSFFGVFFGIAANIGFQNERNLLAFAGIVTAIIAGGFAMTITSLVPHQGVALGFVFLGLFTFMYIVRASKKFEYFGLQAGIAFCFAYLSHAGPVFSLNEVETRFEALLVAGAVAMLLHGLLWPSHPKAQMREAFVTMLRNTADRLGAILRDSGTVPDPEQRLSRVVPHLSELLHQARFTSIRQTADRDTLFEMTLELQSIAGATSILQYQAGLLGDHARQTPALAALSDAWRDATEGLRRLAEHLECPDDRAPPPPPGHALAEIQINQPRRTTGPVDELARARTLFIAECLDEIQTATRTLWQRDAAIADRPTAVALNVSTPRPQSE